ncbi:MAG: ABC transporter substrate-binding protein, partial [Rhodoplanes sp.]
MSRRSLIAFTTIAALAATATARAADKPSEIRLDWATYNPVSMVLKEKGLLEKEFAKDGIGIRWVQTLGSNKALEFLNAGSIDFGSTAGSAALVSKINGNPIKSIYVYSRPEWTALVTRKDSAIANPADLKGKRVAVTRGTDPHIFLVRALYSAG